MFINKKHTNKKNHNRLNISNNNSFNYSRRSFVKLILASGVLSQIPFAASCITENDHEERVVNIDGVDYTLELKLIHDVQNILYPEDELGPGALQLKSANYLIWVLNDHRLDPWDNEYIIKGFKKLNNAANKQFNKRFTNLNKKEQEELIARVSLIDWGQSWLSKMLTLIFESMFANPNYGSNPESIGWKWLKHQAGWPQPKEDQIYPSILEINKQKFKSQ